MQTNAVKKSISLLAVAQDAEAFEAKACPAFDRVIAVSEVTREMMERDYGVRRVYDIPTGVDVDFFRPNGTVQTAAQQSGVHWFDGLAAQRRCN